MAANKFWYHSHDDLPVLISLVVGIAVLLSAIVTMWMWSIGSYAQ